MVMVAAASEEEISHLVLRTMSARKQASSSGSSNSKRELGHEATAVETATVE